MDTFTDLPPMTTDADHLAHASPLMTTNHDHPPYSEMITAAITALKDKDGSSRQAISKYIEKEYPNLPPTHSIMLTQHLKSMKNQGQLVMVKHSYMLPLRSGQFQPTMSTGYHPTLDFSAIGNATGDANDAIDANVGTDGVNLENSPSGLSKRKPGRPPKLRPVPRLGVQHQMPNVQVYEADGNVSSYQPQVQYQASVGPDVHVNYGSGSVSEPLFASLGLGDEGVVVPSPQPTENTTVVAKRGRGRPPKAGGSGGSGGDHVAVSGGGDHVAGSGGGDGVAKAGRGRPGRKPKMMSVMMAGNGGRVKRGRGRPMRLGIGPVTVPLSGNVLRPRGRPKRVGRPNVVVNGGLRRSGRPPVNKSANLTGQTLSKVGPGTAVLVTDPQQLVVYQELKSKYEFLQSKVKQVASMVKSCIDPVYGADALGALQELETLAEGAVNAPPPFTQN